MQVISDKLTDTKQQKLFCMVCWLTYFSTYIGRLNFAACLVEISASAGFSKSALGLVSSGFFIGYGVFQLLWGFVGDRMDPVKMVFSGILSSGILNLIMSLAQTPSLMIITWTMNGIVQAAVWPPLLRLTLDRLPDEKAMHASVQYATTVPFGTFSAYLMAAACSLVGSWRVDFQISGIFMIAISMLWFITMRQLASTCSYSCVQRKNSFQTSKKSNSPIWLILIPICFATMVNGFIRDSVQTWMPTYLTERHGIGNFSSIVLTLILPLVNLSGVYIGTFFNFHFFKNEVLTSAAAFLLASLLVLPMTLGASSPLWAELILFGLCAAMMLAVNTMFITLVPVKLQFMGHTSSLSGILNSATYLGSAISGYGVGKLLEKCSWPVVLCIWMFGLLSAAVICLCFFRRWADIRCRKI